MKHLATIAFILTFFVLLAGCSKSDPAPIPESLLRLTNGDYKDWQLEKVTYLLFNATGQIPSCQRDEIYRFYVDGTGEIRSGAARCNPAEPAVQSTGTWEFFEDRSKLLINWQDKRNWEVTIDELQHNKLVVTGVVFDNYVVTATFRPAQ